MLIFIFSLILDYSITGVIVGIAYYALYTNYHWKFSGQKNFFILFLIFAFLDTFLLPMFFVLDATVTVNNPDIAKMLNLPSDVPIEELIGFGWLEFIIYSLQALLATFIGYKIFLEK